MGRQDREYFRGRQQGLDIAKRVLQEGGCKEGVKLIEDEIKRRGRIGISSVATSKELERQSLQVMLCMYESFLCQTLMVLMDEFDFDQKECHRFVERWKDKEESLKDGLVTWKDRVEAIKEEIDISLPTDNMEIGELI